MGALKYQIPPETNFTTLEESKVGGTMIILPDNSAKTIITVDTLSVNTMYMVYRSMNHIIDLIVNHYGKPGAKVPEFDKEMREISELVGSGRRKHPEVTPAISGDFKVQS